MGFETFIEWCHHTFNCWRGCAKISPGCEHCYACELAKRNPAVLGKWGVNGTRVVAAEAMWREPLKWNRLAEKAGERRRVFCASLADVFEDWQGPMVDSRGVQIFTRADDSWTTSDHYKDTIALGMGNVRSRLFRLIADTPNLDWLILTKRPENAVGNVALHSGFAVGSRSREGLPTDHLMTGGAYLPNVWIGTSVENQETADTRIPHLLQIPAAVRFLSMEPLLGPVKIFDGGCPHPIQTERGVVYPPGAISWVIVGGESGPHARPMNPTWARSIRDQCVAAGAAFHFKQWGEHAPLDQVPGLFQRRLTPAVGTVLRWPFGENGSGMARVGKKAAGRMLDGRTWDELPSTTAELPA